MITTLTDRGSAVRHDEAAPDQFRAVGTLVICAMIAGLLQSPIATKFDSVAVISVDDVLVLCAVAVATLRQGKPVARLRAWVLLWVGLLVVQCGTTIAGFNGVLGISSGTAILLMRQVTEPALIVYVGLVLSAGEWQRVQRWTLRVAAANACYMALEVVGIRLFNPNSLAVGKGLATRVVDPTTGVALPGYYTSFSLTGGHVVADGGLYLNPPTVGIITAMAAVIALHTLTDRKRVAAVAIFAVATVLSASRAGLLILAAGLFIPPLVRLFGRYATYIALAGVAAIVGGTFTSAGKSIKHLDGLTGGAWDALHYPWGRGFGFSGNEAKHLGLTTYGESLAGIAFSAGGFLVLVSVLCLIAVLVGSRDLDHTGRTWMLALALGCVVASLFAETAGSIDATVPLWLLVGYSLREISYERLRRSPSRPGDSVSASTHAK